MILINAVLDVTAQVQTLITGTRQIYCNTVELAPSPVGKHIRHILDHLRAFQLGVENGTIDYNLRSRESEIERNPQIAEQSLLQFTVWLGSQSFEDSQAPVTVISEISTHHCESVRVMSNAHRELIYLINHTLHHVAYAKLIATLLGVSLPEHLGVAPATATHLREASLQCAQ